LEQLAECCLVTKQLRAIAYFLSKSTAAIQTASVNVIKISLCASLLEKLVMNSE
jgi:hypothetical protein